MTDPLVYALVGVIFLLVGGGAGFWFGQKRGREDAAKSGDLQKEFDAYRDQVAAHFGKTADHFQALGVQVRELYDHMAVGADTLCDPARTDQAIAFSATEALQSPAAEEPADEESEIAETAAEETAEATDVAETPETTEAAGESEAAEATEEAAEEEQASSFTVTAPEDEDPDKRSYH